MIEVEVFKITNYSTLIIIHKEGKLIASSKTTTIVYEQVDTRKLARILREESDRANKYIKESKLLEYYDITPVICSITLEQVKEVMLQDGAKLVFDSREPKKAKRKNTYPHPEYMGAMESRDI